MTGIWSFRMPFAVQWAWPVPLFLILLFAPESPWWLVRKGKIAQAHISARRLTPAATKERSKETVSSMIRTNQLEKDVSSGTSFFDCFRGTDLRRTEISMITWTCQIMCGLQFANYSTYFFQQAGLDTSNSFSMTIGLYGAAFVGTLLSWWLITILGRRQIFTTGLFCLAIGQLLIGILSVVADKGYNGARWGQACKYPSLILAWLTSSDDDHLAICLRLDSWPTSLRYRRRGVKFPSTKQDHRSLPIIIQCLLSHFWCDDALHACKSRLSSSEHD
jgi:SP family general alpha glucoside:H+ symporter-like MFS transporter